MLYREWPKFESQGKRYDEIPMSGARNIRCDGKGHVTVEYHDGRVRVFVEIPISS